MTVLPAIIAAAVAVIVAVLTPAVTSLRSRRQEIDTRFDTAVNSLLLVQASRHTLRDVQRSYHIGSDEEYRLFNVRMNEDSISRFIDQTVQARAALAAISRYVPAARDWITSGWELTEEREQTQRAIIEEARPAALKTERLFRMRKSEQPEPAGASPSAQPDDNASTEVTKLSRTACTNTQQSR